MDQLKLGKILFWLFIGLAIIFCLLLLSTNPKDNPLLFISGLLGLLGQILCALSTYLSIRHFKRNNPE